MRFPLDLIYLDQNNTVVHVEENVKPWRFAAVRMDTTTVLELPWHTIWNSSTKVGDQIELHLESGESASQTEKVSAV
jgi:uncharacterized membrane protein (UPF0127 family)